MTVRAQVQQRETQRKAQPAHDVHTVAASGVAGAGDTLPYASTIQHSFGHHDVSGIRAHTGSAAQDANTAMGSLGYATGNDVAFGRAPSLHTAAHEAAHIIQQRAGVQLKGGVGQVGDVYERHADAVADRVVQGKSSEDLLDQFAGGGGSHAIQRRSVQHRMAGGQALQFTGPPAHAGTSSEGNYQDHGNVGQAGYSERDPTNGVGVGVSSENGGQVSADREWTIWEATPPVPPVPVPGLPGLFLTVTPSVKAVVGGAFQGLSTGETQRQYQGSLTGAVDVGLEFGAPPAASIYLRAGPQVQAQASLTFDSQGLKEAGATIALDATARVGVQAANGAIDYNLVLARVNILRIVGFQYTRGGGTTWASIQPGQDIVDALRWAKQTYDRAAGLASDAAAAIGNTARGVGSSVSDAYNWLRSW